MQSRSLVAIFVFIVGLMMAVVPVHAHLSKYSPFPPNNRPKPFPVRKLVDWMPLQDGNRYLAESNRTRNSTNPILKVTNHDSGTDLSLLKWNRTPLAGPFHVSSSPVTPYGYTADLNGDG